MHYVHGQPAKHSQVRAGRFGRCWRHQRLRCRYGQGHAVVQIGSTEVDTILALPPPELLPVLYQAHASQSHVPLVREFRSLGWGQARHRQFPIDDQLGSPGMFGLRDPSNDLIVSALHRGSPSVVSAMLVGVGSVLKTELAELRKSDCESPNVVRDRS
jgi:hypothetical protein